MHSKQEKQTQSKRFTLHKAIFSVFGIIYVSISWKRYKKARKRPTQGDQSKIDKNCDRINHFLTNRVANALKKLPGKVVHAPSVNSFKEKIDQINETNAKRTRSKF
jgi:hypothetical protein